MKKITTRLFTLWSLLALPALSFAQQFHQGLKIEAVTEGQGVKCRLTNPPRLTAVTKNQPYLSYFWDFGDGAYSRGTVAEPVHHYAKAGTYKIRALVFTGNTLDLLEQPAAITVKAAASNQAVPLSIAANLTLSGSHYRDELRPSEDMVVAIGSKEQVGAGKLYVFFNEKQHKGVKPLEYRGYSNHFGEKEGVDDLNLADITTAKALFNDVKVFDVNKRDPSVSNLFLTFKQVSNITNKLKGNKVWIHAIWVANDKTEKANLTLTVVPSHDPNDIQVTPDLVGLRHIANQEFTYKVRFENTAKGVAQSVGIKVSKPQQADTSRIEWLDFSPICPECPQNVSLDSVPYRCYVRKNTKNEITVFFHNAQLAGKTKDLLNKDLNEGFISYKLYPVKNIKKFTLKSKAVISFDGQEKATNTAITQFAWGLWLGTKVGLNVDRVTGASNYFVGLTLSPYKEEKAYLQAEVMIGINRLFRKEFYVGDSTRVKIDNTICKDCFRDTLSYVKDNVKQSALNIVPLQVRWDLSNVLSVGFGTSMDMYFQKVEGSTTHVTRRITPDGCDEEVIIGTPETYSVDRIKLKFAAFGDIQFGTDKAKLGLRYVFPFGNKLPVPIDYYQLYAVYKF